MKHKREADAADPAGLPIRVIARERVRQSVVDYIKELIFDGELRAGDRLPQDDLARALDLSNTPVREAIIALEHEGIVSIEPHRGAFVSRIDSGTIRDQYDLLTVLWRWAVQRAAKEALSEHIAGIAEVAQAIKKTRDPDEMFRLMNVFVDRVELAGGSSAWRRLVSALPRLVPVPLYYRVIPGAMAAVSKWIGDVATGIQIGDATKAGDAIEHLMRAQGETLIAELVRRQLLSD